jgi:DNA-binding GntR family transcriptional regulator
VARIKTSENEPRIPSALDNAATPQGDATTVEEIYAGLREQILDGRLAEGEPLSQVKLAQQWGVNRAPLREALRMLQREGLIHAQYNRRVRVSKLTTADLEELYSERILTEALGIRLTVRGMDDADIARLRELLGTMEGLASAESFAEWEIAHHEFHGCLVAAAGERLRARIDYLGDYARRYRHALASMGKRAVEGFAQGALEHRAIVDACDARDVELASRTLAHHLARTALSLISVREPTHDPATVREALRMVEEGPR